MNTCEGYRTVLVDNNLSNLFPIEITSLYAYTVQVFQSHRVSF